MKYLSKQTIILLGFMSAFLISAPALASNGGTLPVDDSEVPPPAIDQPKLEMKARRLKSGKASVPNGAPLAVQRAIRAANKIIGRPYTYGGGHASFTSRGYDCSGTVSYALHGGGLLKSPMPSGPLMSWGKQGSGKWITVYANGGHAFMQIAGLRLDTSAAGDPRGGEGPSWRPVLRSKSGYVARHPLGL